MKDPLPIEALQIANVVHELCGEACLAGSAPLAKHFHNIKAEGNTLQHNPTIQKILKKITSNDVDIFAPMFPARLAKVRASSNTHKLSHQQKAMFFRFDDEDNEENHVAFELAQCETLLGKRYGLQMCDAKQSIYSELGVSYGEYSFWNEALNLGIRNIFNFKLKHVGTDNP